MARRIRRRARILGRSASRARIHLRHRAERVPGHAGGLFKPGMRVLDDRLRRGPQQRLARAAGLRGARHRRLAAGAREGQSACRQAKGVQVAVPAGRRTRLAVDARALSMPWSASSSSSLRPTERGRLFDGFKTTLSRAACWCCRATRRSSWSTRPAVRREAAHMYTREMLEQAFAELRDPASAGARRRAGEGTKHVGRSALIDLVARKPD